MLFLFQRKELKPIEYISAKGEWYSLDFWFELIVLSLSDFSLFRRSHFPLASALGPGVLENSLCSQKAGLASVPLDLPG